MSLIPQINWYNNGEFMYLPGTSDIKNKIIGFDLDGTITTYKDGLDPSRYTTDRNNWNFIGPIKEKILELNRDFTIVIITNQLNVTIGKIGMIEEVYKALDCIPYILVAHKKNHFRKPNTGFLSVINCIVQSFDITNSYYCGDAIGINDSFPPYRRTHKDKSTGKIDEFGDDYNFALNSGLKFIRPNDLFLPFSFIPTITLSDPTNNTTTVINKYHMILMMGTPGSGKSTYAKILEHYYGYARFSQDEYGGNLKKHQDLVVRTLYSGKCIVLDATFASLSNRMHWLTIGKMLNIKMAIIWSIRDGRPFNNLRNEHERISHHAYDGKYGYTKSFSDPEIKPEGIEYDIIKFY